MAKLGPTDRGVLVIHEQANVRWNELQIQRTLQGAKEILELDMLTDGILYDGRSVRQIFYELTHIALQAKDSALRDRAELALGGGAGAARS